MKTLYFDCGMGAAGDMLTAALFELIPDKNEFLEELNSLGIPGVTVTAEKSVKCGLVGTHISVKVNGTEETEAMKKAHDIEHNCLHEHPHNVTHTHHHSNMHEIMHIINDLPLSEKIKTNITKVYSLIAEAESHVHGAPVSEIHFHEVGTMDAITDITAFCMLMDRICPDSILVSPIHVGCGQVKCAHGILPVPAPATSYILQNIPIYSGEITGELCTPTGAALLKHFAMSFGKMPVMRTTSIGYGMGSKDFPVANCVRVLLGETENTSDFVTELCCNLDDMTPEAIAFAEEQFFNAGALDVYTVPIQMKKSRPGILLSVMCHNSDTEQMLRLIFKHTTTLGVRENISRRYTLSRSVKTIPTEYGNVRKKISKGYGITKEKYEYEDLARIAREQGTSLADITNKISPQEKQDN
ncbi:MAG: nickel pincer cofactor biosynthesis protein LarC [Synergistaceae bacterium]|nr:nickel pincer cofactor biosynthesis protein LarC [Synergistaceae bacterium]